MAKILVLYQDWGDWFVKDYPKFEYWFKELDRGYSKDNKYYILSYSNHNKKIKKEKNVFIELFKSDSIRQLIDLFSFKRRLKKIIEEFKPDYIYSPFIYLLSTVPKSRQYKIVGFLRDNTPKIIASKGGIRVLFSKFFSYFDSKAFKKINIILFNSFNLTKYAKSNKYSGKLIYAPRPIQDIEQCKKIAKVNKSTSNLENKKVILTVARLSSEKNLEMNLMALSKLPKEYLLLLVGEGPEKNNLVNLSKKLKIFDRVRFVGAVPHKKIWDYYLLADVFWLMSKTEGLPNVLNESLYAKLPPIVSKIPEMKEIIKHKKTGLVLKSWNPEELAKATEYLLKDKKLYSNIQREGKLKVNQLLKKQVKLIEVFR